MSFQSPSKLQDLVEDSILRDQDLAIHILDDLPSHFFPSLFRKACRRSYIRIVKAMVRVWPFPCLPLGAMMRRKIVYRRIIETILDVLSALLLQEVPHQRCRLEVLDLRVMPLRFWSKWSMFTTSVWSENQTAVGRSGTGARPPVKVVIDLVLREQRLDTIESLLIRWVARRQESVRLCCNRLQVRARSVHYHRNVLDMLDLDSVRELSVYNIRDPTCLLTFAPYLGRMRRLRSLLLSHIWQMVFFTPVEKQRVVTQFTSQFLNLKCLQSLHLVNVYFLEGHLDELFWWLKAPLETLSVTHCRLSESDWIHISEFPCTSQLKHLKLKWVKLTCFTPEPLRVLLLKTARTLMTLDLEGCQMVNFQFKAILPALRRCHRLIQFNFHGNSISMPVLKKLVYHLFRLKALQSEMYLIPNCDHHSDLDEELIFLPHAELIDLRTIRLPECPKYGFFYERCGM